MTFNPNATGNKNLGVFSLPFNEEQSKLVLLPVPWEVTTSYGAGTALGPQCLFESSKQLDLFDSLYGEFYHHGIYQRPVNQEILEQNFLLKKQALLLRDKLEDGKSFSEIDIGHQEKINQASKELNQWVYENSREIINSGKFCGLIGGDHSSPFGLIKALKEKYADLSILHIDAHMDLRIAYQGYQYSHASIMYNVIKELKPTSLVQMGIRDYCPEERANGEKYNVHTLYDSQVALRLAQGESWQSIVNEAISHLSEHVYISFDIDGLAPDLCPNTGTPVPGGLSFGQAETLLYFLSQSSKKLVGFDLCEVSPGADDAPLDCWDGNVGARILFKMAGALLKGSDQ